jgi:LytS/YehU family sensor histidine kinase
MCDTDPARAKKAAIEFSAYLRGNMNSLEEMKPIPFEKELKHIECFLSLEQAMYGEAHTYLTNAVIFDFFI